ncbi:hypothetical protein AMTR_s00060p00089550 [Amborella trichopoda]|uniref:Uncharacterized protein n=1 Tax=Amborella trichopoda TaxID=13333 RepID=W1NJZ4_AMBTC|nr:hypothetical protein AMTR_s00060p00089550 [Amborella trichopoda]
MPLLPLIGLERKKIRVSDPKTLSPLQTLYGPIRSAHSCSISRAREFLCKSGRDDARVLRVALFLMAMQKKIFHCNLVAKGHMEFAMAIERGSPLRESNDQAGKILRGREGGLS